MNFFQHCKNIQEVEDTYKTVRQLHNSLTNDTKVLSIIQDGYYKKLNSLVEADYNWLDTPLQRIRLTTTKSGNKSVILMCWDIVYDIPNLLYLNFNHTGFAKEKAEYWWRVLTQSSDYIPKTSEEAFKKSYLIKKVKRIKVQPYNDISVITDIEMEK